MKTRFVGITTNYTQKNRGTGFARSPRCLQRCNTKDSLCNALEISINEFYYGEKMLEQDFKHLSEQNLRLYFREEFRKRLIYKFAALGGIMGILIFIIVQLAFLS